MAPRRPVYFNPNAKTWTAEPPATSLNLINRFHQQLPGYGPTRLVRLDEVAKELGVQAVYLKDESNRFSLPSFKILGASWAVFRAVARELGLALHTDIVSMKKALASASRPLSLFAATDGNHGRAVARMGSDLEIPVEIYVPANTHAATIELIEGEGAKVTVSAGNYDDAVAEAQAAAQQNAGILIQDFAFDGYEDIPRVRDQSTLTRMTCRLTTLQWITNGYLAMMREIDDQLKDEQVDLVVTPVGVGSLAQAAVEHFKRERNTTSVLTVEPDTAACLWKSLVRGEKGPEQTAGTIMAGLNCGTVSSISWPLLQSGVDASLTISDYESHVASLDLQAMGISAGPCGSASLAAVRRLTAADKTTLGLTRDSVVVLLSTEGRRDYDTPLSVFADDAVTLTQQLVQINSASPSMGTLPGPGETAIAQYIAAWLAHRGIESHWIEPTKGRPSIVGRVKGSGGGESLMFNGHIDTVTLVGYEGDPLSGKLVDGKIYGRGAGDMKGGLAAAMIALANAKTLGLKGDVILAAVADEEDGSLGTEQVLNAGWRADGAIVNEPTDLDIINAHKGFVWLQVDIHGVAAHGSRPDLGTDAISKAGYLLVELDRYAERLHQSPGDPRTGPGSVHCSIIKGGEEASSYPALCSVVLERRTVAGETAETVRQEVQSLLDKLVHDVSGFKYDLRVVFQRPPFDIPAEHPFCARVGDIVSESLGEKANFCGASYWTDCALLAAEGIPTVLWGPRGKGLHASEEWVEADSVQQVTDALTAIARQFCS